MIYECMWQVSSGLKEDEEGSPQRLVIFSCTELAIFDSSRSTARKLALVPGEPLVLDKCICYIKVCGKSHQD